ncbi:MAG TPA: AMP-binding protein [Rhizomicrobium sp.]
MTRMIIDRQAEAWDGCFVAELPALHPFVGRDVPWLLEIQGRQFADKPFLHWAPFEVEGRSWTYAAFVADVRRLAEGLGRRGLRRGDAVVIHLSNRPEFLLAWFACSWIGAAAVTTNIHSGRGELRYFAEQAHARAAITEAALFDDLAACGAAFEWIAVAEASTFADLMSAEAAPQRPPEPALYHSVMYTSGTTSRPKGVVYTHANVLWAAQRNAAHAGLRPDDVALVNLPLFHANALSYSMLAALWSGGSLVLQPKFSASHFWETAERYGCTWASIGPFVTKALKALPPPGAHRFRFWGNIWGEDAEVEARWGIPSLGWYGMTETVSHPVLSEFAKPSPPGAVGKPVGEYGVRLVDADGRDVGIGDTGKLLVKAVRGVGLFYEYLNDPHATAAAFDAEGWFDTGDMLTLLEDGSLRFADREKDMLKVGGENVAASEVERVIGVVEGVVDVAVVGKPHPFLGETPLAFVVRDERAPLPTDRILDVCRQELAKFKQPREIRYIATLPRTAIGKIDKKALRDIAAGAASAAKGGAA